MCSCHSILECCVTFSGVKLSIRSFVLFQIRRAELIELIQNDQRPPQQRLATGPHRGPSVLAPWMSTWEPNRPLQMSTWEPRWKPQTTMQPELEAPLTKRQLKHRRNKDSKLAKEFKSLEADIDNMKSQMDSLKDKITNASESANARFKRKKIRSMERVDRTTSTNGPNSRIPSQTTFSL